ELVRDAQRNAPRCRQRRVRHRLRLPRLDIVAVHLSVPDGFAEIRLYVTVRVVRADREQGDFVVEVDEAFDHHAAAAHARGALRALPCGGDLCFRAYDRLALAGGRDHRLDYTGVADSGRRLDRFFECIGVVGEAVDRGREAELFGGEAADPLAIHR